MMVVGWYASSVLAIITAKSSLDAVRAPCLLCMVQLCTAAMLQLIYFSCVPAKFGRKLALGDDCKIVCSIAFAYALGFMFTNVAFAQAAPSSVETIKSGEPIATVVLARLALGERERLAAYCSLCAEFVSNSHHPPQTFCDVRLHFRLMFAARRRCWAWA